MSWAGFSGSRRWLTDLWSGSILLGNTIVSVLRNNHMSRRSPWIKSYLQYALCLQVFLSPVSASYSLWSSWVKSTYNTIRDVARTARTQGGLDSGIHGTGLYSRGRGGSVRVLISRHLNWIFWASAFAGKQTFRTINSNVCLILKADVQFSESRVYPP